MKINGDLMPTPPEILKLYLTQVRFDSARVEKSLRMVSLGDWLEVDNAGTEEYKIKFHSYQCRIIISNDGRLD